jgi:hypothetical protein
MQKQDQDQDFAAPPLPAQGADWVQRITENPDVEATKLLFIVGVIESFDLHRRGRIMRYLNERFESD